MNYRIKGIEWIAFVLLFTGLILKWIHIDEKAFLLNIAFVSVGVLGVIKAIQEKYHKQLTVDTLRILFSVAIILLALGNLNGERNYTLLAVNALLFGAITLRKHWFSKGHA